MKTKLITIGVFACLSAQVQAQNQQAVTGTSPESVLSKFEAMYQVRDRMEKNGYTLHRCGIQPIRQSASSHIPHSQVQCVYSKPGPLPVDESELAYWHLNVLYGVESGLYQSGDEFTNYYQSRVFTHEPEHLLASGPHYYRERARLQSLGMTVGECYLQQIYYFSNPTEKAYLSHVATCPVNGAEGSFSGNIQIDIDYNVDNMAYSEKQVTFGAI
ncbi:hypothetical protein M9194_18245 [Vibrio sp. S4M6]|uniref:hypothetical protein n=1 Tax=Vibrio sinus TaxID=2946865 RepID=UPI002029BAD1|nr:hypothetical protein [Vibrio sinus]MCL9783373.1 hypothetical protein [Vibrio sinus]